MNTFCTINITGCYSAISIPLTVVSGGAGGLCGNQMRLHKTNISNCIVNFLDIGSSNTTSYIGGFFGYNANGFTINNSYVIISDVSNTCFLSFIAGGIDSSTTGTLSSVSNSYFVSYPNTSTPIQTLYNYEDPTSTIDLTMINCAFQTGTTLNTVSGTSANNINTYTYNSSNTQAPFSSWDSSGTTFWTTSSTPNTPLLLQEFTTTPFQNYSVAEDVPTLTDLCIFEGTQLLTTQGYIPVEELTKNHVLCTWDGRTTTIQAIYMFFNPTVPCYKIEKNMIAPSIPHDDVYLSGGHAIYIQNDEYIHPFHTDIFSKEKCRVWNKSQYYCIETEDYYKDTLIASGMPIEGFGGNEPKRHTWKCTRNSQCQMIKI